MSSLSDQQLAAAHRTGQDICVVAGPGSGKTSVLIERFSWMVREQGIAAGRILAITFTDKAATEIKQRLVKVFEDRPDIREQIERAYVSTIHSFCTRLLRENAIAAGVDPDFQVLERNASDGLLREVTHAALEAKFQAEPERTRRFLRSLAVMTESGGFVPDLAKSLLDIYTALRLAAKHPADIALAVPSVEAEWTRLHEMLTGILAERPAANTVSKRTGHGEFKEFASDLLSAGTKPHAKLFELLGRKKIDRTSLCKGSLAHTLRDEVWALLDRLRASALLEYYAGERRLILEVLASIDEQYRARKRAISGLDFDDLEEQAIHLLERDPTLQESVKRSFDHILMDELQDTNPLQWKLMALLRRPDRFFAVGDVNQSIFGFRHAAPALFYNYRRNLEAEGKQVDDLRMNYRSRAALIERVNTTFNPAPDGIEEHMLQAGATWYGPKPGPSVEAILAQGPKTEETQQIEALWVAKRITELVPPARFRDIAILTRSNVATGELQAALDEFGIPSIVLGGLTFYDTREVRDLVLLLEVLVNPRNEVALAGVLRSPLFGMTDEDLLRLTMQGTLAEAIENEPPSFWAGIQELRRIRDLLSPDQLLRRVIDESDYESGLSARGRANVEKLLAGLRGYYASNPGPLAKTLEWLRDASPDSEAPPNDFGDAVRLMTIHKAKGLEFPIVFLPFLHAGRGNNAPIVTYSHRHGLGVKWREPHTRAPVGDSIWCANDIAYKQASTSEENRLLYVGMTRAKEHMVLSFSITDRSWGGEWKKHLTDRLQLNHAEARATPPEIPESRSDAAEQKVLIVQRPPTPGQHDSSESVTSISLFAQCPRKYYLSRYLRWQQPRIRVLDEEEEYPERDSGQLDASELGTQVHAILAGQVVAEPAAEAIELAERFRMSALGRRAEKATRKAHESDFVMAVGDLVLRGQIDLWFESNRELVLVDYKTDQVKSPVPRDRVLPYELQLQIYATALERIAGRLPDRAYLYFLRPNEAVEVNVQPLQLGLARTAVREFLQAQEQMEFPLKPGEHCLRCEHYKAMCPAGRIPDLAAHAHRG